VSGGNERTKSDVPYIYMPCTSTPSPPERSPCSLSCETAAHLSGFPGTNHHLLGTHLYNRALAYSRFAGTRITILLMQHQGHSGRRRALWMVRGPVLVLILLAELLAHGIPLVQCFTALQRFDSRRTPAAVASDRCASQ
jgi:hypothetical protein